VIQLEIDLYGCLLLELKKGILGRKAYLKKVKYLWDQKMCSGVLCSPPFLNVFAADICSALVSFIVFLRFQKKCLFYIWWCAQCIGNVVWRIRCKSCMKETLY